MLGLLPILALLFLAVAVILWAVTLFLQGYLYSEPVEQVYWRAPLAGLVMALFVGLWCSFDYKNPGRYGSVFDVSAARKDLSVMRDYAQKLGVSVPAAEAALRGFDEAVAAGKGDADAVSVPIYWMKRKSAS